MSKQERSIFNKNRRERRRRHLVNVDTRLHPRGCCCRNCVTRDGRKVVSQREWPAYYMGLVGVRSKGTVKLKGRMSYECRLERQALVVYVNREKNWSTSDTTAANIEILRRARQGGHKFKLAKGCRLLPESVTNLQKRIDQRMTAVMACVDEALAEYRASADEWDRHQLVCAILKVGKNLHVSPREAENALKIRENQEKNSAA